MLIVVAARSTYRRDARAPLTSAGAVGAAAFATGLVAAAVVIPVGSAILRANGGGILPVPLLTEVRVVVGVGVLAAATAVLALATASLLRRTWVAVLAVVAAVVVAYALGALPILPDEVSRWLLRVTPAERSPPRHWKIGKPSLPVRPLFMIELNRTERPSVLRG